MKTHRLLLGLTFLFFASLISSCTKFDRPAEASIDAQSLEFDNTLLTRQFTIMNMGDAYLDFSIYTNSSWVTINYANSSLSHAQANIVSVTVNPNELQGYGVYNGSVFVQSNGGNFSIPITFYYNQPAGAQLGLDLDYLKLDANTSQEFFTIYNDGIEALSFTLQEDASWLQLSQLVGNVAPSGEQKVYVNVDRTNLASGVYSAEIAITSNGGDAILNVDLNVEVYSVTVFNPVYTPIEITATGFDPKVIEVGDRVSFVYDNNPGSFNYTASTKGQTTNGTQLGVEILWAENIDVSNLESPTFNLNVSADYFFMAVKNTGNYYLNMWSVNYGNSYQIDDDFTIPNDGVEYRVAYYDAFTDTDIYARLYGTNSDVKWSQGYEFVFPWTENQYILLENNFKSSPLIRPNVKSTNAATGEMIRFIKPIDKPKGSIDLYNLK
ncbi:MAG: hypothetical protein JW729_01630 [Bacteroidales bacterium]|nr:hypothetical protein [Bacteroidales bacterium]